MVDPCDLVFRVNWPECRTWKNIRLQMRRLRMRGDLTPEHMQRMLQHYGYYDGAIDGLIGPASRAALRQYTANGCD